MISRRFLRVKVFQALYAYYQSNEKDLRKSENELFLSLERMYDLYVYLLLLPAEMVHQQVLKQDEAKKKRLPSAEDLSPNMKFNNNAIFSQLSSNNSLNKASKERKISWDADQELVVKMFNYIIKHEVYQNYMNTEHSSFDEDKRFAVDFYKKIIPSFDLIIADIQDKSIFWGYDELDFILSMVIKTIKTFTIQSDASTRILPLYRDEEDDKHFIINLLRKTITSDEVNNELIEQKTKNWEVERIAQIDILLMKMALTEIKTFKSIPVKVTLNEYIDLSKWYSTPKSKTFINGVLDKLVVDLTEKGEIKKIGRGLL